MEIFKEIVLKFIQKESLIETGNHILVACSGGVDSVVLLHFLATNRDFLSIQVAAVHIDHMLRGEQSAQDGELVKKLCEELKVPFHGGKIPVPDLIEKEGGNVQAVCREERYKCFAELMVNNDYDLLATAHHADDQLETVLMDVTKGSAPSGIPITRTLGNGRIIRPLLPVVKGSLYNYAEENDLPFNEDPSNESDAYMRNRFRRHIVPQILKENPQAAEKVFSMTKQLQEDEAFLQVLAKEQIEQLVEFTEVGLPSISSNRLISMPTALQRRVITLLLGYLYDEEKMFVRYKSSLIEQIIYHLNSSDGNVSIDLPLSYQFLREYDKLTFVKERRKLDLDARKMLPKGVQTNWIHGQWLYWSNMDDVHSYIVEEAKEIMYFDLPTDALPLFVRRKKDGDRIFLAGMKNAKRLSRLFIDEKVSRTERDELPVVVTSQDDVCAVPGLRYSNIFTKHIVPMSKYIFVVGER